MAQARSRHALHARRLDGGGRDRPLSRRSASPLQCSEDLIEQIHELSQQSLERAATIEQVPDSTKEIAQQVAGARDRCDRKNDLIQMNYKSKQVEVGGPSRLLKDAFGRNSASFSFFSC
jgi:methyl-accepting chemotaxis protein